MAWYNDGMKTISPGTVFGSITALECFSKKYKNQNIKTVRYQCSCGVVSETLIYNVLNGRTKSCPKCSKRSGKKTTHGMSKTRTYRAWGAMKSRCNDKNNKHYDRWGGRGIKVCDRWNDFSRFHEDMGDMPDGMSLDRIDNDGDYCPKNCRWATPKEQANNTRRNIKIKYKGDTYTISELSKKLGINRHTINSRVRYGWGPDQLDAPPYGKTRF